MLQKCPSCKQAVKTIRINDQESVHVPSDVVERCINLRRLDWKITQIPDVPKEPAKTKDTSTSPKESTIQQSPPKKQKPTEPSIPPFILDL